MADSSGRRSTVKASIDNILHRLAALPSCPEVDSLRAQAGEYLGAADAWTPLEPVAQEKERLMKRVLRLHVDVTKLERQSPGMNRPE
jgi:hypothetical protein